MKKCFSVIIRNVINWVTTPFSANLPFFAIVFLLLILPDSYKWIGDGFYNYWAYFAAINFIISYVLTLVINLLSNKIIGKIYKTIVLFFLSLSYVVDYFFVVHLRGNYFEIPVIVKNTNFSETSEFLSSFLNLEIASLVFITSVFLVCIYYIIKKFTKSNPIIKYTGLFFVIVCILLTIHNPSIIEDSILKKSYYWFYTFTTKTPDLHDYLSNPKIVDNQKGANKVVVIIGESFSKFHSSLYGYEKETNPKLSTFLGDNFFLFDSISSPDLSTLPSFKQFMTDYRGQIDSRKWHECLTSLEVFSKAGYKNTWISNQHRVGFLDNDLSAVANLADECIFIKEIDKVARANGYDEYLIAFVDSIHKSHDTNQKDVYWIHLMGSHHDYKSRYPLSATKFVPADYPNALEHQRLNLSYYDNSVLYNDSVVYQLIDLFKDDEAMIVYFSDHGMDLYYTDPNHFYYGRGKDHKSACMASQIPLMVYLTDEYIEKNPDLPQKLRHSKARPFNTRDLIYLLMDMNGLEFENNHDVKDYSPLN